MASPTYSARVIVLRKTKLGESDLILTLLSEDGSQLRAVAKGARKPTSSFAARLELYSVAEVLCSKGKSLDIIKEARLIRGNEGLRREVEYAAGAAPMAELLDKVAQMGLANPKLFAMTDTALSCLCAAEVPKIPAITAAQLLKALALSGFRPSLQECAICGSGVSLEGQEGYIGISHGEGGVLCDACSASSQRILLPAALVQWMGFLMFSTFDEVSRSQIDAATAAEVLKFCKAWIQEHVGASLKSLNFMLGGNWY